MFTVTGKIIATKKVRIADGYSVSSFVVETDNHFFVGYNYSMFYSLGYEGKVILFLLPTLEVK